MHSPSNQTGNASASHLLLLVTLFVAAFGGYLYWLSSDNDLDRLIEQLDTEPFNPSDYTFYDDLPNEKYTGIKESPPSSPATRTQSTGSYYIQVGAFGNRTRADQVKAELVLLDVGPITIRSNNTSKDSLNRVLVGPFNSYSLAATKASKLQAHGHPSVVLKKK